VASPVLIGAPLQFAVSCFVMSLRSRSHRACFVWLAAVYTITLCACSVGPNYHRPEAAMPSAFSERGAAAARAPITKNWWTSFSDPELNGLIDDALLANQDIQAAMSRVEEAAALVRVAKSDLFPSINLDPSFHRARTLSSTEGSNSGEGETGSSSAERAKTTNTFSLPLALQYELDIWGKLRREAEYYQHLSQASESDFAFVQQTVLANVAQTYFNIRLSDTQLDIYRQSLELFRHQQTLTQAKYESGLALKTDVLQAQTQVNSAVAQVTEIQRARSKQEHALAILLGKAPEDFHLAEKPLATPVPIIPVSMPAALLNQRPDVATAERKLAAANAQIGVAEADFYPTFSVTGSAGYESSHKSDLLNWSNHVWSIAPGVSLPLFDGGQRVGTLAGRRAEYRELVANYRLSILNALRDVEDELSDLRLLADKAETLAATLRAAKEYSQLTEAQYKQGITTYLQVMDANQTLLTNQLAAVEAQDERLIASVLLVKALGGGWEPQDQVLPTQRRLALNIAFPMR
jgi:multidrug efflux system outer membrane protein